MAYGVLNRKLCNGIILGSGCGVSDKAFQRSAPREYYAKRMERGVTYFYVTTQFWIDRDLRCDDYCVEIRDYIQ